MYTINNFAFGLNINTGSHENLINRLLEYGIELFIPTSDSSINFSIEGFYHGGADKDYFPGIIGFDISSNDNNLTYWKDIREANELRYLNLWEEIYPKIMVEVNEMYDEEDKDFKFDLLNFFHRSRPEFYEYVTTS